MIIILVGIFCNTWQSSRVPQLKEEGTNISSTHKAIIIDRKLNRDRGLGHEYILIKINE